jgi:hypothetical protein
MVAVVNFTSRFFDRLFGSKLVSVRSLGVSACFSLASLGIVCTPGLWWFEDWYPDIIGVLYVPLVVFLVVMGILPAALGSRLRERFWLVGVLILCFATLAGMHMLDWFDAHRKAIVETTDNFAFLAVTIGSDATFIAITRWLLRRASGFRSFAKILGVMSANLALAAVLVALPTVAAWSLFARRVKFSGPIAIHEAVVKYTWQSNSREIFLSTLAGSNVLDAVVAAAFFLLLFMLLLHRILWPTVQRSVYPLAKLGIARRRSLFLVFGFGLIGLGGISRAAMNLIKKIVESLM